MDAEYDGGDKARLVQKERPEVSESDGAQQEGGTFQTKIGLALSCIGCVVGTGNIWRFPRILANNSGQKGCLQFLLIWVIFLFIWSIPMLIIEYSVGRFTKKSTILSFQKMIGVENMWGGAWIALVTLGIAAYYSVIVGWCLYYLFFFIANELPETFVESNSIFYNFSEDSFFPVLCHFVAIAFGAFSVAWGVKSIELANCVVVPVFLVLLLFTFIWSMTLENAGAGIKFMFSPDWEQFKQPGLWVDAVTQNAFDTGAGSGLFISYAAYMTSKNGIVRYGTLVPLCNNVISLLCGMVTFSTVFSSELKNGSSTEEIVKLLQQNGPGNTGLTFVWMPILYNKINGGRVFMVFFFFSLLLAGFSSLVAQLELFVHNMKDFGVSRKIAAPVVALVVFFTGLGSALSLNFLVNQDFVWGFGLLLSGMALQFLVIRYGIHKFREELVNKFSESDWPLPVIWEWIVKFIAPLEAVTLIVWWAVTTIMNSDPWYGFSTESFMITIAQWSGFFLLILLLNFLYVKYWRHLIPIPGDVTELPLPPSPEGNEYKDGTYRTFGESETSQ
ncbi:uncharacterized sodium-dependent transporter HI_0736-like [Asterias rubens]|uniref:uncharacterized sodium-dependent transporter HI_0736-like n=1 Tax=Asterias rubens TaxID=7604 RepID=UPI0014555EB3|nr:uncharacterized sodium-dependent transporter HI_0736-like [Asterias rubens]